MANETNSAVPRLRLLEKADISSVLDLMDTSHFPISGLVSHGLYRALCHDGLSDPRVLIGVAEVKGVVAAFLLVIVDYASYWKNFLIRHPLLGLRMLSRRLRRRPQAVDQWEKLSGESRKKVEEIIDTEPSGRDWSDSGPSIAKGVFLQVNPQCRRLGLAVRLYEYLFDVLKQRGVRRCDAKVDVANTRAHPLHVRMGYHLERQGNTLFATRDL